MIGAAPSLSACAIEHAARPRPEIEALQVFLPGLVSRLIHGGGDAFFHFGCGIVGEGVAEVLHDVQMVTTTNHAQPDHVIGRVEQVRAMRGGKHEMFVAVLSIVVERNIFSLLIKLEVGFVRQTDGEGGLAVKLM